MIGFIDKSDDSNNDVQSKLFIFTRIFQGLLMIFHESRMKFFLHGTEPTELTVGLFLNPRKVGQTPEHTKSPK